MPFNDATPLGICMVAVSLSVRPRLVAVLVLLMMRVALLICQFLASEVAAPMLLGSPPSANSLTETFPPLMMVAPV